MRGHSTLPNTERQQGRHKKMAKLTVYDKAGDVVADGLSAETFVAFKRRCGKGTAVIVKLERGDEVMVDSCKVFRKLPRGASYTARLVRSTTKLPKEIAQVAAGRNVWVEV